ncbi:hypothetical protein QQ045_024485 [Rhodiola kirilowii]
MSFAADFCALPEGCVANIISLTSPPDACRLALVSNMFRSAAESDAVWERFFPRDYQEVVARSDDADAAAAACQLVGPSKKQMFFRLCEIPILIDGGLKSFFLDKWSGKKCYMISARDLDIVWGDTPSYWKWMPLPESRFPEVAELRSVCWLEIHGKIESSLLSTETNYAAYLVFKFNQGGYGFDDQPAEVSVGISGGGSCTKSVYLDYAEVGQPRQLHIVPRRVALFSRTRAQLLATKPAPAPKRERSNPAPKERRDGWLEIELGEYFIEGGEIGELEMSLSEVKGGHWKAGLVVQGIEVRPKGSQVNKRTSTKVKE